MNENKSTLPKIGIGSFAFRYAIGFNGFQPPDPMSLQHFIEKSHQMGFAGVQLCENLQYIKLSKEELLRAKAFVDNHKMFIELGMKELSVENLNKHLDLAELFSAKFLRLVIGGDVYSTLDTNDALVNHKVKVLMDVLPRIRQMGVVIGIENHFDLPSNCLVEIVRQVNDENVGLILDTTNGVGFVENIHTTMRLFKPYIVSMHLKDYIIKKVEAGYRMEGTSLGEGWLNLDEIISYIQTCPNLQSIVLEMTTFRGNRENMNEIIEWEEKQIQKSFNALVNRY